MEWHRKVPNRRRHGLLPIPAKWASILMVQLNAPTDGTLWKAGTQRTENSSPVSASQKEKISTGQWKPPVMHNPHGKE